MASAIGQPQDDNTVISTAETIQLSLLEQAKERNVIAKEHNAIAKERNAIAREQVTATKQQTVIFSTLATKVDAHEAILKVMGSKLATVILQPSLPDSAAAATKTPLKPEEPMELIGCTIADADFIQLLNCSLKQPVIADFFGLPTDIIDPFPHQSRIKFAARLKKAFRGFYNKFQAISSKYSPFPCAFLDILARCVDRRCALIAIDCAKTRSMRLMHYMELVNKTEQQIKRMKYHQAQSLIADISTRRKEYDSKALMNLIGVLNSTSPLDAQTQEDESEHSATEEKIRETTLLEAGSDSEYESDSDSDSDSNFDVKQLEDDEFAELADVVAATHFRTHKPTPLAAKAKLGPNDSEKELASQKVHMGSGQEADAEKPVNEDSKITEETPVIMPTLAAPISILESPTKGIAEVASQALGITSPSATELNMKPGGNIMEPSPQVHIMDSTPEGSPEPMDTEEIEDCKPSEGYTQLPVSSTSSLVALLPLPTSVAAKPFSFAFSTPTTRALVPVASVAVNFGISTPGLSSLRQPTPQVTTSLVSLSTPFQSALKIVAENKTTQSPLFQTQFQPVAPQVQEEDMTDVPETKKEEGEEEEEEEQANSAAEVKEEGEMSDAPPAEQEDEQMSDASTTPVQENAAVAFKIDFSPVIQEKMKDAPVSVPEEDMKDISQAPVGGTHASPQPAAEAEAAEEPNDLKMKEAPVVKPSQTQQAFPAAESSFSHNQGQYVLASQAPIQHKSSDPASQPLALPVLRGDRKLPSEWASRNPPAAPSAVFAPATLTNVSQFPPISPEQLMGQIIKLVELNNKKQFQQTSINRYTIKWDCCHTAAESLVKTRWHEYRNANNGVALEKVDYLSRVKAELEQLLKEPSRANWEYVAYSMIQEMVLNDVLPKTSELKYIPIEERKYWVRLLCNVVCSANRELVRMCIASFSWEKMKTFVTDMEVEALEFNSQFSEVSPVSYTDAMKACVEKWSKEGTLREFFAEQVRKARDQNALAVEKRPNITGLDKRDGKKANTEQDAPVTMQIAAAAAQVASDAQQTSTNTLQTFTTGDRMSRKRRGDDDLEDEKEEKAPVARKMAKMAKMAKPQAKKIRAKEVEGDGE